MIEGQMIICMVCGKDTPKTTRGIQKYCPTCSQQKDLERKKEWNRKNKKYDPSQAKKKRETKKSIAIETGAEISRQEKKSIFWIDDVDDTVNTQIRVAVPFMYGFSKNATWSYSRKGHVFLRKEQKQLRNLLISKILESSHDINWYEDKVWIDIFVQKPNHRGDAINVVDAVCDAVKEAIDVDDRWFSIKKLDWQITKEEPMLYVGIGQNQEGHKRICSLCGRIMTLDKFYKDKSDKLGVSRECKECGRGRDKERRERKRQELNG